MAHADYPLVFIPHPPVKLIGFDPRVGTVDMFRVPLEGSGVRFYIRAQDDGYATDEYFYWYDEDGGTGTAPPPAGSYYNVTILGQAQYTGGLVIMKFTDAQDPLTESLYRLRAKDSGLSSPGYVYWADNEVSYTGAPAAVGTLSDLTVMSEIEVRA
jgi:hypothetical protein